MGIDCHSQFVVVAVVIPDFRTGEQRVSRRDFANTRPVLQLALQWVRNVLARHGIVISPDEQIHYSIESTAAYHFPLVHCWGGDPCIVNPNTTKLGSRKTDNIDAGVLAEGDMSGRWAGCKSFLYPPNFRAARIMLRRRKKYATVKSAASKAITNILLQYGHTIQGLGAPHESNVRPLVEDWLAGRKIHDAGFQQLIQGQPLPQTIVDLIGELYGIVDKFAALEKDAFKRAKADLLSFEYGGRFGEVIAGKDLHKLLLSVPGVGPVSALVAMSEIVTLARFRTMSGLLAWAGFDPTLRISAGKVTAYVTRKGCKLLQHTLTEAGQAVLRDKGPLGQWARALKARLKKGAGPKSAKAAGRRVLEGIWHVWRLQEPWRWHGQNQDPKGPNERGPSPGDGPGDPCGGAGEPHKRKSAA